MAIQTTGPTVTTLAAPVEDRVAIAARHMYEAEITLHAARQAHIDTWIAAASDKLHQAIVEHLTALGDQRNHREPADPDPGPPPVAV